MSFKLISFDGYDFNAAGYTIKPPQDSWRGQVGNTVTTSNRPGLMPTLGPASMNARRLTYDVIPPSGTDANLAIETLITKLRPMDPIPRTLIAEHPDASGTAVQVQRQAVIEMPHGAPGDLSADIVRITFVSADPAWRVVTAPSAVTIASYDSTSWSGGTAYTALGSAPINPTVTIDTGAPGSGSAPNRYSFTVTNNRSYPLVKLPWLVNLGSTTGWTGSTAANTFLFSDGVEVPREVIAMGEANSWILFTIDRLAQGQVKTYEILTGGTAPALATTAQALSGRIKAPVPDFGWKVVTTTAAGTGTTTVTASALSTGEPYVTAPTDRWKGGVAYGLTGASAGQIIGITANSSTTLTTATPFTAYASGSKFLVMSSWLLYSGYNEYHLNYAVRLQEHSDYPHGLWYEDVSQTKPGDIRYDSPLSWEPARTFDNNDDVASKSVSPAVGDYFTTPNLYRTWAGGDDNSNLRERGSADSVVFSSQLPVLSWTFDYAWKNPNGVARAVMGSRQSQAEDWTLNLEDVSVHSTLTDIAETTITPVSETLHLLFGVWPLADYEEIPTSWRRDSGGRSGGGYTTMDDDTKTWPDDIWIGARWRVTSGKGQGQSRTITDNDANTLIWSSALPSDDVVPNDGSRYEVVNPALIANLRTDDYFKVVLSIADIATSALTSMGAAERVSLRVRANGGASATTSHVRLDVGVDRYLWVASGNTVVIDCTAQTALVMNGSTVVRDVTDWVRAYEALADTPTVGTMFTGKTPDWFAIQPGAGTFYTQRVLGAATHATSIVLRTGYLG
jgi:hypothetical protein